jgi:hypothetical protein
LYVGVVILWESLFGFLPVLYILVPPFTYTANLTSVKQPQRTNSAEYQQSGYIFSDTQAGSNLPTFHPLKAYERMYSTELTTHVRKRIIRSDSDLAIFFLQTK